jgi:Spy/CpxP family protein refolding chaperone
MKRLLLGSIVAAGLTLLVVSPAMTQPPGGKEGKGGGQRGAPRFELGQIFPPPLMEELKLTAEQEKELDAIRQDLKAKLEKLLTAEQKKTIENFRPRGMGGPGGDKGGKGGGKGGDKGGKGGGDKGGDRPERPPVE